MTLAYKVAIPSWGRPDRIKNHPLLAAAHVVMPESQRALYESTIGGRCKALVAHNDLRGGPITRNFILDQLYEPGEDFVFMCDDDLDQVRFVHSRRVITYRKPDHILEVIEQTARLALDAGSALFGYNRTARVMERMFTLPFTFRRVPEGNAIGMIGHDYHWDEKLVTSSDIDLCLQTFKKQRFVVQDQRYAWMFDRWSAGGNAGIRTTESMDRSFEYLEQKWGKGIVVRNSKRRATGRSLSVRVN